MATVFERIEQKLNDAGVPFTVLRHEPVFTSEQAAAVRGTPLSSGAKALVLKAGDSFVFAVLPADRKLDSKKTRDDVRKQNDDAIVQMKKRGLKVDEPANIEGWQKAAAKASDVVRGKVVPPGIYDEVKKYRDEYRAQHKR